MLGGGGGTEDACFHDYKNCYADTQNLNQTSGEFPGLNGGTKTGASALIVTFTLLRLSPMSLD